MPAVCCSKHSNSNKIKVVAMVKTRTINRNKISNNKATTNSKINKNKISNKVSNKVSNLSHSRAIKTNSNTSNRKLTNENKMPNECLKQ